MTRLFTRFALAAAAAGLATAPCWAQTPVPTSPNDPLARIHGWVEPAPGSQGAKPEADAPAAKPAAGSEAAKVGPEPPASRSASGSQTAPEAKPAPEPSLAAKPASASKPAPEQGEAAASGPAPHRAHVARHARAGDRSGERRAEVDRRPRAGDRSADQLNRQELNKLTTARGAAPTARP
jgi:hypothetical protein